MRPDAAGHGGSYAGGVARAGGLAVGHSIETGKAADLTLYDIERPEWTPCHDPVRNLVYCADGRSVRTVLVEGEVVYDGGHAAGIDSGKLLPAARAAADAIARRLKRDPRPRWPRVGPRTLSSRAVQSK